MAEAQQEMTDEGALGSYFAMMLHIDDDDLDPYEYKLLGHYRKVCGLSKTKTCYESIETTAANAKMSVSKARDARNNLEKKGCIRTRKLTGQSIFVNVVDRMGENVRRYSDLKTADPYQIQQGGAITSARGGLSDSIPNIRIEESKNLNTNTLPNSPNGSSARTKLLGQEIDEMELPPKVEAAKAAKAIANLGEPTPADLTHFLEEKASKKTPPVPPHPPLPEDPAPAGFQWFVSDYNPSLKHLLRNGKGRPVCKTTPFNYPQSNAVKLVGAPPCAECLRIATAPKGATRKPSSDLTDAMHSAIPESIRPPGKPHYGKHSAAADVLHTAGFTPERIASYVKWAYANDDWFRGDKDGQPKIITMYQVSERIKAYEVSQGVSDGQTAGNADVSSGGVGGAGKDGTGSPAVSKFIPPPDEQRDYSAPRGWTGSRST